MIRDPPDRPDLAIYSQEEQLALGLVPSWDSPDIVTNNDKPWTLRPDHVVTVRNLSAKASAVNGLVHLLHSDFGIGLPRSPISSQVVDLAPGQQVDLAFPLPPSILSGPADVGAHVVIEHPYDARRINNRGSQIVHGLFTSDAGRNLQFQFPVLNPSGAAQTMSLALMPNALGAAVAPASYAFNPWQQITATLTAHVPGSIHGTGAAPIREVVTVVGFDGSHTLVDGLTYIVWVDE